MRDFWAGFSKEAASPAGSLIGHAGAFMKKRPRLGIGLAAGAVGVGVGGLAGAAVHKQVARTGDINPHAYQEQVRRRQMDRYGSF